MSQVMPACLSTFCPAHLVVLLLVKHLVVPLLLVLPYVPTEAVTRDSNKIPNRASCRLLVISLRAKIPLFAKLRQFFGNFELEL